MTSAPLGSNVPPDDRRDHLQARLDAVRAALVRIDAVAAAAVGALDRVPWIDDPLQRAHVRRLDGLVSVVADIVAAALAEVDGRTDG